jgi:hypothetical protein
MIVNKRRQQLIGCSPTQKANTLKHEYRGKEHKLSAHKSATRISSAAYLQEKLGIQVVNNVQSKNNLVQEVSTLEENRSLDRSKANKFKGKKKFDKSYPRSKSYRGNPEHSHYYKKRSAKRMAKMEENLEELHEYTAFSNNSKSSTKKQNSVIFKNSKSGESLVPRTRRRSSQADERDLRFGKSGVSKPDTAKNDVQKEFDNQWAADLPESVTLKEKQYLLAIEDQAERNRELSRMTESGEIGSSRAKYGLAVVPTRRSHIRQQANSKRIFKSSEKAKLDEQHFDMYHKNHEFTANEADMSVDENSAKSSVDKEQLIRRNLDLVSKIRARGEIAKKKAITRNLKKSPNVQACKTPQSKVKMSPVPFPNMDSEEEHADRTAIEVCEQIQQVQNEKPKLESKEEAKDVSEENEEKRFQVIVKVQNQAKDVSVPLVTEIQPKAKPLKDYSFDTAEQLGTKPACKLTPTPVIQQKQIVDTIKEQFGNIRSPAKITNRMIIPAEMTMQPILEEDSEFKTPLPKKPRSAKKHDTVEKSDEVMTTFPMRMHMNERPEEFDHLYLPKKFQILFDFFHELDNAINNCKRRGKMPVMSNLKPYIEQATNRTFDEDHFRKLYYIAQELFFYKWQYMSSTGNYELRIEIPENIEEVLYKISKKGVKVRVKHNPLSEPMTNFLTNKRKILVRTRLILYMENLHNNFLSNRGIDREGYGAVKGWHPNFDIETIMDLPSKTLKNMPRSRKSETITEFLKTTNIKQTLLKRAAENVTKETSPKADIQQNSQSTNPGSLCNSYEKRSPAKILNSKISPTFYKRIETKERLFKEEQKNLQTKADLEINLRKRELMLKIAQAVKSVFSVNKKVNTLFLNNVLKFLNDSQRGNFYGKKELIKTLKEISEIVPEWLTLKQHERGFLVKISKTNLSTIRNKIIIHTE